MKKHRRNFTPEQKVSIVRQHLLDKIPVSELCDKHGLQPTVFYRWQKDLFENAPIIFRHKNSTLPEKKLERKLDTLEEKLAHKDSVIAEIMADHIQLKKELGEL
jgi:transposase